MKTQKKYIIVCFLLISFISISTVLLSSTQNTKSISINGTYQNEQNTFNTLVFDEEFKTYYNYNQFEQTKGDFEKTEENTYLLKTGTLKNLQVKVEKNEVKLIDTDNNIEIYKKISDLPTIQNE